MLTINLKDIYGFYCLNEEEGKRLFNIIKASLVYNSTINIDFIGIKFVSSLFLEYSFGPLLNIFSRNFINDRIKILNINKKTKDSLLFTMDLFERYYTDKEFKRDLDKRYFSPLTIDEKKITEFEEKHTKDSNLNEKTNGNFEKEKRRYKKRKRKDDKSVHPSNELDDGRV